jgi:nucleoid DNA-binding protein
MKTDLISGIRGLLFRHDCVIIPGFGGFICNYVPASIDKASGMFYPPARRVSFNRNLTNNDGLLIGDVSRREGIGYGEARDIIEQFAAEMKRRLSKGEMITLDLIGTFRTNQEGSIQFEPDSQANYNAGSFGMDSFRFEPVAGYDVRKRVMKVHGTIAPTRVPLRKLLVRAAVAIPVLIALVAVPLKTDIFGSRLDKASLNPLASVQFEDNRQAIDKTPLEEAGAGERLIDESAHVGGEVSDVAANSVGNDIPETVGTTTGAQVTVVKTTPETEVVPSVAVPKYYVIAGSFQSEANAMVMAGMLRSMGYEPVMMDAPDGYTRVAARGYADISSANAGVRELSSKVEGLWILQNK